MSHLSLFICALFFLSFAVVAVGCEPADDEMDDEAAVSTIPAAFARAHQEGLAIEGYRDADGLKRLVEHYFQDPARTAPLLDDSLAQAFGLDVAAVRGMEEVASGMNLDIYRVEFVPGLERGGEIDDPLLGTDYESEGDSRGLMPGFPSGEGLARNVSPGNPTSEVNTYRPGKQHYAQRSFSDGSTWTITYTYNPDGSYVRHEATTGTDGKTVIYESTQEVGPNGEQGASHETEQHDATSEAEDVREEFETAGDGGNTGEGEQSEETTSDGGEGDGNGDVDQFQPAEGGEGTFCPLTLEYCRRAFEEALASVEDVKVGKVVVNPGDPDDEPEGSRLVYDPDDLVINPSTATPTGTGTPPDAVFRLAIPVWVNPPGPDDPM